MALPRPTELTLIRHAPVVDDGCAYGRRDVLADCSNRELFAAMRDYVDAPERLVWSPARRCVETAQAIWPGLSGVPVAAFWEQDLGDWEGRPYSDLPDLGPLSRADLARHRPAGGESFEDLYARVAPALRDTAKDGDAMIIAHAGTIRAALATALDVGPAALAFDIAPLSVTRLAWLAPNTWIIRSVGTRIA